MYIPEAFSQVQERSIRGFFEHNHYVEGAMLNRFSIQRHEEFMNRLFPDALKLENCFVSEHLVGQLREEITQCAHQDLWLDLSQNYPAVLTEGDFAKLLAGMPEAKGC